MLGFYPLCYVLFVVLVFLSPFTSVFLAHQERTPQPTSTEVHKEVQTHSEEHRQESRNKKTHTHTRRGRQTKGEDDPPPATKTEIAMRMQTEAAANEGGITRTTGKADQRWEESPTHHQSKNNERWRNTAMRTID